MKSPPFPQGLRSFSSFRTYYDEWLLPHFSVDLETVFEGAKNHWIGKGSPPKGRGDFILAIPLFAAFDHLGSFLAPNKHTALLSFYNIARMAGQLQSTQDIRAIVASLGRNALVHGCWPQTGYSMNNWAWGFGLNICADPEDQEHDLLYIRYHVLRRDPPLQQSETTAEPIKILKLVQNVHVLANQLIQWIRQLDPESIDPAVFQRVQNISTLHGVDIKSEKYEKLYSGDRDRSLKVKDEIKALREQAVRFGIWDWEGGNVGCPRRFPERLQCRMRS